MKGFSFNPKTLLKVTQQVVDVFDRPAGEREALSAPIDEDSTVMKVLGLIPVIGIFVCFVQEGGLTEKIASTPYPSRAVQLIDVKMDYKIVGLVRCCIEIALLIMAFVMGVFLNLALTGVVFLTGLAVFHIYSMYHNEQARDVLRENKKYTGCIL